MIWSTHHGRERWTGIVSRRRFVSRVQAKSRGGVRACFLCASASLYPVCRRPTKHRHPEAILRRAELRCSAGLIGDQGYYLVADAHPA